MEAGSALFGFSSRGVLLVTAGCSLSRDPTGIIGSPSLRDEPPGYVATEEQNRVNNKSDSFLVYCDIRQISILKSLQFKYLEFFLQAVHLGPEGVYDVLPVFQHEVLQLLRGLYLLNFLQREKKNPKHFTLFLKIQTRNPDVC